MVELEFLLFLKPVRYLLQEFRKKSEKDYIKFNILSSILPAKLAQHSQDSSCLGGKNLNLLGMRTIISNWGIGELHRRFLNFGWFQMLGKKHHKSKFTFQEIEFLCGRMVS